LTALVLRAQNLYIAFAAGAPSWNPLL